MEFQNDEIKTSYRITEDSIKTLKAEGVSDYVLRKLEIIKEQTVTGEENFLHILKATIGGQETVIYKPMILKNSQNLKKSIGFKVERY